MVYSLQQYVKKGSVMRVYSSRHPRTSCRTLGRGQHQQSTSACDVATFNADCCYECCCCCVGAAAAEAAAAAYLIFKKTNVKSYIRATYIGQGLLQQHHSTNSTTPTSVRFAKP